jgi:hypothetical protein
MKKALLLLLSLLAVMFIAQPASAATTVIYDAVPAVTPASASSLGFQATGTDELGDRIVLGGTDRDLSLVTLMLVTWSTFTDPRPGYTDWDLDPRYSGNAVSWSHPITLNVYADSVDATTGVPDVLLGSVTQNVAIPWRPDGDPTCPAAAPGYPMRWRDAAGTCSYGMAFNATFDLTGLAVVLPASVIVGVAYDTQTVGYQPIGVEGPYNSLNVAIPANQTVSVGSDANTDSLFWRSQWQPAPVTFKENFGWTPNGTLAIRVEATAPVIIPPGGGGGGGTPPPVGSSDVNVVKVRHHHKATTDLNHEFVVLLNTGSASQDLAGWTVIDRQGHEYTFGSVTIAAGQRLKLHTGVGSDAGNHVYWNAAGFVWNVRADRATLTDASGVVVSDLTYRP